MSEVLLEVAGLRVGVPIGRVMVDALKGIDFSVRRGEAFGLVGESGSGKSLTALAIMRLIAPPAKILAGRMRFAGRDLADCTEAEMRTIRGREISIVFQDSLTSLNPAFTIGRQLTDVISVHQKLSARAAVAEAVRVASLVGILPRRLGGYPHEFSGGMRQRALIAMAIACRPQLLIADEPTTALDVTIQAQIIDLLAELRQQLGLSMVFITHNLDLMAEICDRALVLYDGQVMETGTVEKLFGDPRHPYTRRLLDCIPRLAQFERPLTPIPGQPPSLGPSRQRCAFEPRCSEAMDVCRSRTPVLSGNGEHRVACWANAEMHAGERP
jgi:oligopeptide/dipeptide ABC transporter ATP-binding protein